MTNTVFILGIGAHKGGTTWLAQQFKKAGVAYPLGKEAHIWDRVEAKRSAESVGLGWLDNTKKSKHKKSRRSLAREKQNIRNKPSTYASYYKNFSKQNNIDFVGDITPLYSILSVETLGLIRSELIKEGFQIKVFFSARDPYKRAWSSVRAGIKRRDKRRDKKKSADFALPNPSKTNYAHELFAENYQKRACEARTRYELIIPKLREVFMEDELKICFFEDVVTTNGYTDLAKFIGLTSTKAEIKTPSRVSPSIKEPDAELKAGCINHYSATYKYMMQSFPKSKVLWADSIKRLTNNY